MNLQSDGKVLRVSNIPELNATNAGAFRDQLRSALTEQHQFVELDLSQTRFLDSSGLGALIAVHKTLATRQGGVRIARPTAPVLQILELTRMHRLFEIIPA